MKFDMRAVAVLLPALLLAGSGGCGRLKPTAAAQTNAPGLTIEGPATIALGDSAAYSAVLRDSTGKIVTGAAVVWTVTGAVRFSGNEAGVGSTVMVDAATLGAGMLTAAFGAETGTLTVQVVAGNAHLVLTGPQGSTPPDALGAQQTLALTAVLVGLSGARMDVADAQWTHTGTCDTSPDAGATVTVTASAAGSCTVTVTSTGLSAEAQFTISTLTGVQVVGSIDPVGLGGSTNLTAVAVAGTTQVPSVPIVWSVAEMGVVDLVVQGNMVNVLGSAVGAATLTAAIAGTTFAAQVKLTVVPMTMTIAASGTRLLAGGAAVITVTPNGALGLPGHFASTDGLAIVGAAGFATVGPPTLTADGLVTFALGNATADSPSVTAQLLTVTSNALAFKIVTVTTVKITGPDGPVRVGSTVDLAAEVLDADGLPISGTFSVAWSDATGVYTLPAMTMSLDVTATVALLGVPMVIAAVDGVSSAPFTSLSVPGSVSIAPFSPSTVAVGGTATTLVSVLDTNGGIVPGVPPEDISVASDTPSVTLGAGTAVGSTGYAFTATAVAPTNSFGADVSATWKSGTESVTSAAVQLVVTAP